LIRLVNRPPQSPPVEPPEKRRGLSPEQREKWLKEFGLRPRED